MNISRLPINNYSTDFLGEHAESIFASLTDAVCITDSNGMIQYINDVFSRLFTVTSTRVKAMSINKIVKSDLIKQAISKRRQMLGHIQMKHKMLSVNVTPISDPAEHLGYYIILKEDAEVITPSSDYTQENPFPEVIGKNKAFVKSLCMAQKAAKKHVTILLRGESGTGKELIAQQIHKASKRCDKSFVAINCAAIPENLIESELFGYEVGAFTGANKMKKGHFELANGGTIFLDEIGDLPLNLQVKLLRVLQERSVRRVGGQVEIPIDVRIVTATHRDLEKMIQENDFREDLYYRLNVIGINLNPLRERKDDIKEMIVHTLDNMTSKHMVEDMTCSQQAMDALVAYDWPGNIRELKNTLERAVIMADGPEIILEDLPSNISSYYEIEEPNEDMNLFNLKSDGSLATLEEYQQDIIYHAVESYGSFHAAAKVLGINHKTVASKYRKYMSSEMTSVSSHTHL